MCRHGWHGLIERVPPLGRDDRELTISLGYQATVTSDGDFAVLREYDFDFSQYLGGIQANLENSLPANGTQPVLISADPPTPVAVIVGPTTVGYCDAAVISAELSYGGGPRALQFKWKAEDHEGDLLSSRVPPIALSTFLSITVYGSDTPYMFEFGKVSGDGSLGLGLRGCLRACRPLSPQST